MRLFLVGVGILVSGVAWCAPKYHVTKVDTYTNAPNGYGGLANDGAMLYSRNINNVGPGINYQDTFTRLDAFTGVPTGYGSYLTAHDIFSSQVDSGGGVSYYKGVSRFSGPGDAKNGYEYVGPTNASGDYVGSLYKPTTGPDRINPTQSRSYVMRNGVRTFLDDFNNIDCSYPTGFSNSGYICGVYSTRFVGVPGGESGWYVKPGTNTKTAYNLPIAKVSDTGDLLAVAYGQSSVLAGLYSTSSSQFIAVKTVAGLDAAYPDMNNHRQVVFTGGGGPHRTVGLWDSGQSWWLEDLVDNPQDLPTPIDSDYNWMQPHINDAGTIMAFIDAGTVNGKNPYDLYRFDPIAVPEPSSIVCALAGMAMFCRKRSPVECKDR